MDTTSLLTGICIGIAAILIIFIVVAKSYNNKDGDAHEWLKAFWRRANETSEGRNEQLERIAIALERIAKG